MTYGELVERTELLKRVAEGSYEHGLDLRPLSRLIAHELIRVNVVHPGVLQIRLSAKGKRCLEHSSHLIDRK